MNCSLGLLVITFIDLFYSADDCSILLLQTQTLRVSVITVLNGDNFTKYLYAANMRRCISDKNHRCG